MFFLLFLFFKNTIFLLVIKPIKIRLLFSLLNKFLFYEFLCIHHCRTFSLLFLILFFNNIRNNGNFSPFFLEIPIKRRRNTKQQKKRNTKQDLLFFLFILHYLNIKIKIKDKTKSSISILKNTKYTLIN